MAAKKHRRLRTRKRPAPRSLPSSGATAAALLKWYDRSRRHLPWRAPPGMRADPYHVWLSEIMLQQTTVATVSGYFAAFLRRWPSLEALAQAPLDEVLHAWQGLGYYARARNLHRCAQMIVERHGGQFPDSEAGLRALPGIGAYTAAAIAAIAFDRRANAIDANIERVVARLFAVDAPMPEAKKLIAAHAAHLVPGRRSGDYIQAMMDLGATICTPRAPQCPRCPLAGLCRVAGTDLAATLPRKRIKKPRPVRHAVAFVARGQGGAVLLRRRAERGLLGGMMEVPSTEWRATPWTLAEARAQAPAKARWRVVPGQVRHVFTHFEWAVEVAVADIGAAGVTGQWAAPAQLGGFALPTAMKKLLRHAGLKV